MSRIAAVGLGMVLAVGCVSVNQLDGLASDGPGSTAASSDPDASNAAQVELFCQTLDDLRELGRQPSLASRVPVDRSVVEQVMADSDAVRSELARNAAGLELAADMDRAVAAERWIDESLLAEWGDDGEALLRDADTWGGRMSSYVSRRGVEVDGEVIRWVDYQDLIRDVFERASLLCDEPPTEWTAVTDLDEADVPADLRYAMVINTSEGTELALGSASVPMSRLPRPRSGVQITNPIVSPDGQRIVARGISEDGSSLAFMARIDSLPSMEQINPDDEAWECLSWSPDSASIIAMRRVGPGAWKQSSFAIESGEVSDLFSTEYGHLGSCGVHLDADTLLVTHETETGDAAVWKQDVGSDERELFASIPDCTTVYPQVRPGTREVAVITACENAYDNGLWVVDADTGEQRHVLKGWVGAPTWSPDGEWILFGHGKDATSTIELWIAAADGTAASRLVTGFSSWPAWIPATTKCPACPD